MDFTREPIIETVITPRDGYKIVVRSSKSIGQEEYFVESVEVVSFGEASFFRSMERPKAFLVPVSDYEVLEVREARIVLKNVGLDRSIKIAGGKEGNHKPHLVKEERVKEERNRDDRSKDERVKEERESRPREDKSKEVKEEKTEGEGPKDDSRTAEGRGRRDRRRGRGRRRTDGDETPREERREDGDIPAHDKVDLSPPRQVGEDAAAEGERISNIIMTELLTPPPTLISETLHRYRDNALFQSAFYTKEELAQVEPLPVPVAVPMETPAYESFEVSLREETGVEESEFYPEFTDFDAPSQEEAHSESPKE